MQEYELKYGCNPNQKPSRIFMKEGELPIKVLSGRAGYINFLDAFNGWQLVRELKKATGMGEEESRKLFCHLFFTVHGAASLIASNALNYKEEEVREILEDIFREE